MTLQEQYTAAQARIKDLEKAFADHSASHTLAMTNASTVQTNLRADLEAVLKERAELQAKLTATESAYNTSREELTQTKTALEKARGQLALSPGHVNMAPGVAALDLPSGGDAGAAPSAGASASKTPLHDQYNKLPRNEKHAFWKANQKAMDAERAAFAKENKGK